MVKAMDGAGATGHNRLDLAAYRLNRTNDMIHAELRALYNYWNRLRAGSGVPLRSDIDPRDMGCDARNLFILEEHGQGDIRFRLAGSAILDVFEKEFRALDVRAIMVPTAGESLVALIREVLEDPGIGYARLSDAEDARIRWEVNLLPLRSDSGRVDRVIGCLHPLTGGPQWGRKTPLRFQIDHMSVDPVGSGPVGGKLQAGAGLAEDAEPFLGPSPAGQGAGASQPQLTAIDGDGVEADETGEGSAKRRRDHLRLVRK